MTAPTPARENEPARLAHGRTRDHQLAGTLVLAEFMLRRDRIRLTAWALGTAAFWLYYTRLVPSVYKTQDDLEGATNLLGGSMGRMFTGPALGFSELTHERFVVGAYGLYILLLAALVSIFTVVRHTRAEEQAGRADMVRANLVGPRAPLTAALLATLATNLAMAAAIVLVTVTAPGFGGHGALLFAVSNVAVGLVFAGITAVTVQVTEFSRAAAGLAGGILGVSFVLRALGDMARQGGSVLSWLSPLAWSQQTAPYVFDRWWPLAIALVVAASTAAIGIALSARRDVGASLLAARPGPSGAADWLRSPFTLALRLQRAGLLGWGGSLLAAGLLFGAWAQPMADSLDDLPETMIDVIGGDPARIVDGYIGLTALFMALIIGIYALLAVQGLRTEETSGRLDPVLATPVARTDWLSSNLLATALNIMLFLGVAGLATGIGAAPATGDGTNIWAATRAHVAHAPAVLVVLTAATALYGLAPRLVTAAWALLAYSLVIGVFGPAMNLPSWSHRLSPFEHVGRAPLEPIAPYALATLATVSAGAAALGLAGIRHRDINT